MKKLHSAVIAVMFTFIALADGNVLWVDKANGLDGTGRGSESSPYRTIQAAVNAAVSGDTIKVKPGIYDEGSGNYNSWDNRVLISGKVLKIVSTGGKDVTHIVGDGTDGSLRCVCFNDAEGSVVEGFTIRDGAATYPTGDAVNGRGGGVLGITASKEYSTAQGCVVDCVVSNCVGVRGGAFAGATAVRCWITENSASHSGGAGRGTDLVNCLITRNKGEHSCLFSGKIVNCTVVDNELSTNSVTAVNSVVCCNGSLADPSPFQLVAPLFGDYRVRKGGEAETAGDASRVASSGVTVPSGVDLYTDFNDNGFDQSGTIAAGCIQTVVEPQGGAILFSGQKDILTRGKVNYGKNLYAFAETYPTQFMVQAVNKGNPAIFSFNVKSGSSDVYVYPTMDDTAYFTPPSSPGKVSTNSVNAAVNTYYVNPDPAVGSDSTVDGTKPETPYKTIQAALDACGLNKSVIRASEGDYNEGGTTVGGLKTRINMSARSVNIRLIGAGAGQSVIWGAPDPSTGGMGAGGTRCVYSGARGCVQGFTLRDGYANGSSSGDTQDQRGGAVCYNSASRNTNLHILDCVITNCWAYRGGAGYSGAYERCHITDSFGDNGVMRYGTLISCVVDNLRNGDMAESGNNNLFGLAYNCTFIGRNTGEFVVSGYAGSAYTNCIFMTTKGLDSGFVAAGSIAWNVPNFTVANGVTLVDPKLADVAGGDYRPVYNDRSKVGGGDRWSPALGGGVWFELPEFSVTDFASNPLNLAAGKPTVGAYQWPFVVVKKAGLTLVIR